MAELITIRTAYPEEYPVPYYRHVVCDRCQKGFDSHKYGKMVCPICRGLLLHVDSFRELGFQGSI